MSWVLSSPSFDDLIRLLKAWKFWVLGAVAGALIGAILYYVAPPSYRARATVNVDFNLEEAWPEETDRQQFYYLERESRKLEEVAWSDEVIDSLASDFQVRPEELRAGKLQLSQPSEAGWHFYAEDRNRQVAQELASAWASLFAGNVRENVANSQGLNSFIRVDATQVENPALERSTSFGTYLFTGAILFLSLSAIGILLLGRPR